MLLVLAIYDYIITLHAEFLAIWSRQITGPSLLFLANRYGTLVLVASATIPPWSQKVRSLIQSSSKRRPLAVYKSEPHHPSYKDPIPFTLTPPRTHRTCWIMSLPAIMIIVTSSPRSCQENFLHTGLTTTPLTLNQAPLLHTAVFIGSRR